MGDAEHEFSDAGSGTDYESTPGSKGAKPESVTVLRLKLALADKQAKQERDRDARASEARDSLWQIEREKCNCGPS